MKNRTKENLTALQKRAKRKYFTNSYLPRLIGLDSPLQKSYLITAGCAGTLTQNDKTVTAKYCNQRWCSVCNPIRTAKMITGYGEQIKEFVNPYFVTLTVPNCTKDKLKDTLKAMDDNFRKLQDVFKKRKIKLKAIRKLEITYNAKRNNYHPHYHLVLENFDGFLSNNPYSSYGEQTLKQVQRFILCQIESFEK